MTLECYTDGACSGNPGPGGWAWAIWVGSENPNDLSGTPIRVGFDKSSNDTTNNIMEMTAMKQLLMELDADDYFEEYMNIKILCDSKYVVSGILDWRAGWEEREFANVKNSELWKEIFILYDSLRVVKDLDIQHIPGHAGIYGNEYVDELAVNAMRS